MKITLAVILGLVLVFYTLTNNSFAYEEKFDSLKKTLDKPPYICVLERYISGDEKSILRETRAAVDEWRNVLKSQERSRDGMAKWEIGYEVIPLSEQREFDYSKCNITVNFEPRPQEEPRDWQHTVGITQYVSDTHGKRALITIYYLDTGPCEASRDEYYIYYKLCYYPNTILAVKQANVARHEIGHALGLGHYVADDPKVHETWAKDGVVSPSIMTPFVHANPTQQKITQKDVEAVRKIYGAEGFQTSKNNLVADEKIPPLKTETKPDAKTKIPSWIKNNAKWWSDGTISDSDFIQGIQYLIQQKIITVSPTKNPVPVSEIPFWVKNTAKWWSMDLVSDADFLKSIQYLLERGILVL